MQKKKKKRGSWTPTIHHIHTVINSKCIKGLNETAGLRHSCHINQLFLQHFSNFPSPEGEKGLTQSPLKLSLHSYWALHLCTDQTPMDFFHMDEYWKEEPQGSSIKLWDGEWWTPSGLEVGLELTTYYFLQAWWSCVALCAISWHNRVLPMASYCELLIIQRTFPSGECVL